MIKMPITLYISENVLRDLHLYVPSRKFSEFVSECVIKGIEAKRMELLDDIRRCKSDVHRISQLESLEEDD